MSTHTVNRLILELQTDSTEQAFHLRQTVAHTWQPMLMQVLDEVCARYNHPQITWRVDRLELDLGYLPFHQLEEKWMERFRQALTAALYNLWLHPSKDMQPQPQSLTQLELLTFFLQTGHFPWWASTHEENIGQLLAQLLQTQPEALKNHLQQLLNQSVVAQRFGYQCPETIKAMLVDAWDTDRTRTTWFEERGKQIFGEKFSATSHVALFQKLKNHILLQDLLQATWPLAPAQESMLETHLHTWTAAMASRSSVARPSGKRTSTTAVSSDKAAVQAPNPSAFRKENPGFTDTASPSTRPPTPLLASGEWRVPEPAESQKFYIRQAGMILTASFLPAFFQALQLTENKAFCTKESAFQGIHLLHYMATGSLYAPEYTLPLYKLLCGIDIHEPVPLEVQLTEDMRTEANELLQALIEHWKALKSTSIEGFRQAFLNREGILTRRENGWLLQIEHHTYDLLLEQLPWGISLIRLPWMPEPIHTEW